LIWLNKKKFILFNKYKIKNLMDETNSIYVMIFLIVIIIIVFIYKTTYLENFEQKYYLIKNIEPQVKFNSKATIAFVYFYTPNIFSYAKHSILNILSYAEKHNYAVIIYDKPFNDDVSMCWNKIVTIMENLKNYEYLVWMDADAIIVNPTIKIESFIEKYPGYDLYLCEDIIVQKECINSGVMIIANTKWTNNLFNNVWTSPIPHLHNDQNVIYYEIVKDLYPHSKPNLKFSSYCGKISHPKVKILPENAFNTHILNYNQGDFIIHLMGAKEQVRIDIMRQINTKIGLDNYEKKDCLDIINLINNADRIYDLEKTCLKLYD
jgi:hypothetical protein